MDDDVVMAKLESLDRCVSRIRSKIPVDFEAFSNDLDSQEIIALNLERSVQLCVDISLRVLAKSRGTTLPASMADSFRKLLEIEVLDEETTCRLVSAVGFRNISVHSYKDVNPEIVWSIVQKDLQVFSHFARQILAVS